MDCIAAISLDRAVCDSVVSSHFGCDAVRSSWRRFRLSICLPEYCFEQCELLFMSILDSSAPSSTFAPASSQVGSRHFVGVRCSSILSSGNFNSNGFGLILAGFGSISGFGLIWLDLCLSSAWISGTFTCFSYNFLPILQAPQRLRRS